MQLSLISFGAIAAGGLVSLGRAEERASSREENGAPEPIEIDISGDAKQGGAQGILYSAAEFLIVSISGCIPKGK